MSRCHWKSSPVIRRNICPNADNFLVEITSWWGGWWYGFASAYPLLLSIANVTLASSAPTSNYFIMNRAEYYITRSRVIIRVSPLNCCYFYILTITAVPATTPFFWRLCVIRLIANHCKALSSVSSITPSQSPENSLSPPEVGLKLLYNFKASAIHI